MNTERFLFGAGGHAKVVLDALQRLGLEAMLLDDDRTKRGMTLLGAAIEHPDELGAWPQLGHLCVGNNRIRAMLLERLQPRIQAWFDIIHPQASVAASAAIEPGVFVATQAVVGPDCRIGTATFVNHGAVADHDCRIGRCCHIAPHATLGGAVELGDQVLVGAGAVILPGVKVGVGAIVGAGAVVTRDVAAYATVVGIPAGERT